MLRTYSTVIVQLVIAIYEKNTITLLILIMPLSICRWMINTFITQPVYCCRNIQAFIFLSAITLYPHTGQIIPTSYSCIFPSGASFQVVRPMCSFSASALSAINSAAGCPWIAHDSGSVMIHLFKTITDI